MEFFIEVPYQGNFLQFRVERIHHSNFQEKYKVSAKGRSIILETNWPQIRRRHLSKEHPSWKLEEGQVTHASFLEVLIICLEKELRKRFDQSRNEKIDE